MVPRGKYLGVRVGDPPRQEADHFIRCPACDGWIDCRDLGQVFEHEGPFSRIRLRRPRKRESEEDLGAMRVIHSAQFELSVDGVPRSYRDRKDLALQSAQILKARNPNSVVKLKDLQTGEEIVIAFESRQQ